MTCSQSAAPRKKGKSELSNPNSSHHCSQSDASRLKGKSELSNSNSSKKGSKPVHFRVSQPRQRWLQTTIHTLKLLTDTKKNYSVEDIAIIRKTTPRNIYYRVKQYIKVGYMNEQRELLQAGSELLKQAVQFSPVGSSSVQFTNDETRAHDLQFRCEILEKPDNWDEHRTTITRLKKYNPRKYKWGHSLMQDLVIDNVNVRVTPKAVLIKPLDIYAHDANEAITRAVNVLDSIVPQVENLFAITLRKERKCNITVSREHIALVHNHIAAFCKKRRIALTVRDEQGKLRMITDNSMGRPELEAVNPQHAEDDIQNILENDLQDKILNKFYPASTTSNMIAQIAKNVKELGAQVNNLAQVQENSVHLQDNLVSVLQGLLPQAPQELKQIKPPVPEKGDLRGYR